MVDLSGLQEYIGYKYKEETFVTLQEVSDRFGISYTTLHSRLRSGWSIERAIETPVRFQNSRKVVYKGKTYKNLPELCKELHIHLSTVRSRLKSGMTLDDAVVVKTLHSVSYKGKTFTSLRKLCEAYDINYDAVMNRKRRGVELVDAIEGARNRREYSSVTFAGETFETLSALCRAYDKDANVVRRRISGGWSLADAIAKPVKHKKTVNRRNARKVEYKGTTYKSIADLARNYKVNYSRVLDRLRRGDTIEEAMIREDRRKNT